MYGLNIYKNIWDPNQKAKHHTQQNIQIQTLSNTRCKNNYFCGCLREYTFDGK